MESSGDSKTATTRVEKIQPPSVGVPCPLKKNRLVLESSGRQLAGLWGNGLLLTDHGKLGSDSVGQDEIVAFGFADQ